MLKYYYDLLGQPSRALYIFLHKAKINFEKCPVALRKGEHKTPEYAAINPFKLVPAIDDDGYKLIESVAIFRYLARKNQGKIADHWYPNDPQAQSKVDTYLEWQHLNTRINCAMYFQHNLLIPLLTQSPPDTKQIAEFKKRMENTLKHLETVWLKENPYIAGSQLSFADVLAICELQQPGIVGYDVCKGRPKLADWYNRVRNELQPEFNEASIPLEKLKKMYAEGNVPIPKL